MIFFNPGFFSNMGLHLLHLSLFPPTKLRTTCTFCRIPCSPLMLRAIFLSYSRPFSRSFPFPLLLMGSGSEVYPWRSGQSCSRSPNWSKWSVEKRRITSRRRHSTKLSPSRVWAEKLGALSNICLWPREEEDVTCLAFFPFLLFNFQPRSRISLRGVRPQLWLLYSWPSCKVCNLFLQDYMAPFCECFQNDRLRLCTSCIVSKFLFSSIFGK